eukprot:TRINITY_DN5416_c0_g1_i1.p1 TRINITY_DN5416_c0_g1~~TRINITY_DN5416_c0_g1_i1.p1  ORF type:complete len:587 (+),score=211.07 TRINITY_DN5416_c0_g1_i1:100-1761(+)
MSSLLDVPPAVHAEFHGKYPQSFAVLKLPPAASGKRVPNSGTYPPQADDPVEPTSSYDSAISGSWGSFAHGGPVPRKALESPPRVHDASFAQWEVLTLPKQCTLSNALDIVARTNRDRRRLIKIKLRFADASELTFERKDVGDPATLAFRGNHLPNKAFEKLTRAGKRGGKNQPNLTFIVDSRGHRQRRGGSESPTRLPAIGGKAVSLPLRYPTSDERKELFQRLDPNGNGMLSLAELDRGVIMLWPEFNNKPAVMRAYKAADVNGTGFIGKREFKYFLKYLQYYNDLWRTFSTIDSSADRRVTLQELREGASAIAVPKAELEAAFRTMDRNKGGYVLFDEFAMWMAKNKVDKELGPLTRRAQENAASYAPAARSRSSSQATRSSRGSGAVLRKRPKLPPLNYPTSADRKKLFERLDPNGNGTLSLAELDKGVVELWPHFNHKPALMRAYKAADTSGNGWIGKREFKHFLKYIVYFVELWNAFADIDTSDDRRLSREELARAGNIFGMSKQELNKAFDQMDKNQGGHVLFDEFCMFMAQHKADLELTKDGSEV